MERFIEDGYLRLPAAFAPDLARDCVEVLADLIGLNRGDPSSWTEPVVRVAGSIADPIIAAINTHRLIGAIDQLVGVGQWQPRRFGYGTFPIRFPSDVDPGDTGWHIDGSFGDAPWYRVNFASKGRALLLLMLFSDVGHVDAPTRIRVGSHLDVARALAGIGPQGCAFNVTAQALQALDRPVVHATGNSGDVFLCHPFLVHAASWPHRGTAPRFMAQPCLHHPEGEWLGGFDYDRRDDDSAVKQAVRNAVASITLRR